MTIYRPKRGKKLNLKVSSANNNCQKFFGPKSNFERSQIRALWSREVSEKNPETSWFSVIAKVGNLGYP